MHKYSIVSRPTEWNSMITIWHSHFHFFDKKRMKMKSGNTGSLKLDVTTKKYRSLSERFNGFDKFERQCITVLEQLELWK